METAALSYPATIFLLSTCHLTLAFYRLALTARLVGCERPHFHRAGAPALCVFGIARAQHNHPPRVPSRSRNYVELLQGARR
jgi:hypothetical protein